MTKNNTIFNKHITHKKIHLDFKFFYDAKDDSLKKVLSVSIQHKISRGYVTAVATDGTKKTWDFQIKSPEVLLIGWGCTTPYWYKSVDKFLIDYDNQTKTLKRRIEKAKEQLQRALDEETRRSRNLLKLHEDYPEYFL